MLRALLIALLCATFSVAHAAHTIDVYDEGIFKGSYEGVNFVGSGAVCGGPPPLAVCTISGGGGGSSAFNDITSGTNTTAAMVVGSGATLTPSGTGVIDTTEVPLVDLAAHGDLCAAGQFVTRNTIDTANQCVSPSSPLTIGAGVIAIALVQSGKVLGRNSAGTNQVEQLTVQNGLRTGSGPVLELDQYQSLASNPTFDGSSGLCHFTKQGCPGGGFICEGNAPDTNEQLYCFPDVNGADTTDAIALTTNIIRPLLSFATCGNLTGTNPLFLGDGSCDDPAENRTQTRIRNAATFENLSCQLSATTGAQTATITARSGACGGSLSNSSVVCTIGAASTTCDSGSNTMTISANECISLGFSATGALPSPCTLQCSMERTS